MLSSITKQYGASCCSCMHARQSRIGYYEGNPVWGQGEFVCVLHKKHLPYRLNKGLVGLKYVSSIACIDWAEAESGEKYFVGNEGLFTKLYRLFGKEMPYDQMEKGVLYYLIDPIEKYMEINSLKDATEKEMSDAVPSVYNRMAKKD